MLLWSIQRKVQQEEGGRGVREDTCPRRQTGSFRLVEEVAMAEDDVLAKGAGDRSRTTATGLLLGLPAKDSTGPKRDCNRSPSTD